MRLFTWLVAIVVALVASTGSSHARVTMQTGSGRACAANCIDKGGFFCANAGFTEGVCCDDSEETCRYDPNGLCSFDLQSVEYVACPYEPDICGESREVKLLADGNVLPLSNLGAQNGSNFLFSQLCTYELIWPAGDAIELTQESELILEAESLSEGAEVKVTVISGNILQSEKFLEQGDQLMFYYPAQVYVVAKASDQGLQSSFTINASFKAAATASGTSDVKEEVVVVEVESDDVEA